MKRKQQSQSQDRARKIKRSYTEVKAVPAVEERETVYEYEKDEQPKLMGEVYLEHRLQDACDRKKIQKFYWKALLRSIVDLPEREQHNIVLDEIQLIKDQSSSYHLIVESIEDRASFLNELSMQFDKHANKKKIRMTELVNICATLDNLRLSTLYVIQRISQWRSSLKSNVYRGTLKRGQELSARHPEYQFYFKGNNVTRLLQHDTDFIKQSIMTRFIEFSTHIDPLFTEAHLTTNKDVQIPKCIAKFLKVQSQMAMRIHQADASYKEMLESLKINSRRNIVSRITNDHKEQESRYFVKYVKTEATKKPMLLGQTFIKESTTDQLKKRFKTEPKIQLHSMEVELSQKEISRKSIGINTKTITKDLNDIVPTVIQAPSNPQSAKNSKKQQMFTSAPPSNVFENNVNMFPRINRIMPIQSLPTDRNMFVSRRNWVTQRAVIEKQLQESIFCEQERLPGKRAKRKVQRFSYIDPIERREEPKVEEPKVQEPVEVQEPEPVTEDKEQVPPTLSPPEAQPPLPEQPIIIIPKIELVDIGIQKDKSEPPSIKREVVVLKREPAYLLPARDEPPKEQPPEEPIKIKAKQAPARPREEPPKELPKEEPRAEPPKVEPPKIEPIKVEPPKAEPPKVEPPKIEPPREQPKPEPKPQPPKQPVEPPKKPEPLPEPPKPQVVEPKPVQAPPPPKPRPKNHVLLPSGHYVVPRKVKLSKLQAYINFYYTDKPHLTQETVSLKKILLPQTRLFTNMYFHEFQQDTKAIGFSILYITNNPQQRVINILALKMFTLQQQAHIVIKEYVDHLWRKDPANKISFIQHSLDSSAMIPEILVEKLDFQVTPNELKFKELKTTSWTQKRKVACQKTNLHHSTFLFEMSSIATERLPNDAVSAPELETFSQYNFYKDQKLITALTKYKIKSNGNTQSNTVRSATSSEMERQAFTNFKSLQQVNKYLEEQKLSTYKADNISNVSLAVNTIYDNFPVQYISNDNSIIFRTDNVVSFFGKTKQYDFLLMNLIKNNAGYSIAFMRNKGMVSEEEKLKDRVKKLMTTINNEFKYEEPTVIRLGELNKQLYGKIANIDKSWSIFGNVKIGINWIDYLEGGKVYDLPQEIQQFEDEMTVVVMNKTGDLYSAIAAVGIIDNDFSEESEQA